MSAARPVWPFRRSRARIDAERLLAAVVQISRQPSFFGEDRVADTLQGRLEVVTLHASLALIRLKSEAELEPLGQSFTDVLFRHFDAGLREAGVGDTTVPKRMRALAGDFYGRLAAYGDALSAADRARLEAAIARNMLGQEQAGFAPALADYALANAALQSKAPAEAMFRLDGWAPAPA